jgi:hypothetical protein
MEQLLTIAAIFALTGLGCICFVSCYVGIAEIYYGYIKEDS